MLNHRKYQKWISRFTIAVFVFFLPIFLLNIFTLPFIVEPAIRKGFSLFTNASIELDVRKSNFFRGIEIHKVIIAANKDREVLFQADRVNLSYRLLPLLTGSVAIRDFTLENPVLRIIKTKEGWNYESITGSSTPKSKPDTDSHVSTPFSLPVPLRFAGSFRIRNLSIQYRDHTGSSPLDLTGTGFSAGTDFETDFIQTIPTTLEGLDQIKKLILVLNPQTDPMIHYKNGGNASGPIRLRAILNHEKSDSSSSRGLEASLEMSTEALVLKDPSNKKIDTDFKANLSLQYNPARSQWKIQRVQLGSGAKDLLRGEGELHTGPTSSATGSFQAEGDSFDLSPIGQMINLFLPQSYRPFRLPGHLKINDLNVQNHPGIMTVQINVSGDPGAEFATSSYRIRQLVLKGGASFRTPSEDRGPEEKNDPFLESLMLNEFSGRYNGSRFHLQAHTNPDRKLEGKIEIRNLKTEQWSAPYFYGPGTAHISFVADQNFKNINLSGEVSVNGARYSTGQYLSSPANLFLKSRGSIAIRESLTALSFEDITFLVEDRSFRRAAKLTGNTQMQFGKDQSYIFHVQNLEVKYARFKPLLPDNLQDLIDDYEIFLKKGLNASGKYNLIVGSSSTKIRGDGTFDLIQPGISDLKIHTDLAFEPSKTSIQNLQITALRKAFQLHLDGWISSSNRNLKGSFSLSQKNLLTTHKNLKMKGNIQSNFTISSTEARGNLDIDNLNLVFSNNDCLKEQDSGGCQKWYASQINLNLPVVHSFKESSSLSFHSDPVLSPSGLGQLYNKTNFKIQGIYSNKKPSGEYSEKPFYIAGNDRLDGIPAVEAKIEYKNNTLFINNMILRFFRREGEGRWSRQGSIQIHDLFFNLNNLKPEDMEYGMEAQIKNFNLAPYLKGARTDYDGIISADASVRGSNLADPVSNVSARLSVHRLSEDFSGFATRVLVPAPMVAFTANQTLKIPAIELELKGGLVYSSIMVEQSGIFSRLIRPSRESISQERIPLAQFIERAKTEVQNTRFK